MLDMLNFLSAETNNGETMEEYFLVVDLRWLSSAISQQAVTDHVPVFLGLRSDKSETWQFEIQCCGFEDVHEGVIPEDLVT